MTPKWVCMSRYRLTALRCRPPIFESPREDTLITTGEDGVVFTFSLDKAKWTYIEYSKQGESATGLPRMELRSGDEEEEPVAYNNQVVLMGVEEMEEHVEEVNTLKEKYREHPDQHRVQDHQMDTKFKEDAKMSSDRFEKALGDEKERYEGVAT